MQALFFLAFVAGSAGGGARSWARSAAALRPGGPDRRRLRLHLQLPGADLAGWGGGRSVLVDAGRSGRPAGSDAALGSAWRCSPSSSWSPRRSAGWSTSTASRPSTPTAPGSATSSARSRPSRRSGSGPRATSGWRRATARCRRRLLPRRSPSRWCSSSTASSGCWRRRETAILAGLAAAALAYAAARIGGTPYTAAKAIEIAAPLVALAILLPLLQVAAVRVIRAMRGKGAPRRLAPPLRRLFVARRRRLLAPRPRQRARRPDLLLLGPQRLPQGRRRRADAGRRLAAAARRRTRRALSSPGSCAAGASASSSTDEARRAAGRRPLRGHRRTEDRRLDPARGVAAYAPTRPGKSPCPLIAVRQARQGPAR